MKNKHFYKSPNVLVILKTSLSHSKFIFSLKPRYVYLTQIVMKTDALRDTCRSHLASRNEASGCRVKTSLRGDFQFRDYLRLCSLMFRIHVNFSQGYHGIRRKPNTLIRLCWFMHIHTLNDEIYFNFNIPIYKTEHRLIHSWLWEQ